MTMMQAKRKLGRPAGPRSKRKGKGKRTKPLMTRAHVERMKTAEARARTKSEDGAPRLFPDALKINFWVAEIDYQGQTLRIGSFSPKEHAAKMAERWRSTLALDDAPKKRRMPSARNNADKSVLAERAK